MNKSKRFLGSQRGQGLVEYVLLLVVVVTIALTFMNLFFKPYAKWAQRQIGDYVECLLDQGELPALGGTSLIKECELKDADFADASASGSKSGTNGAKAKENDGSSHDSDSGGGKVSVSSNGRDFKTRKLGAMDGSAANSKQVNVGVAEKSGENGTLKVGGLRNQNQNRITYSSSARGFAGMLEMEQEKIKKREQKTQKVSGAEGSGSGRETKKFTVEKKEKKQDDTDFSTDGWSFGKLFRLLLIIVLVIAIVLFIGGQVMQISKSMEK